jgi:hypothetical protein
MCAASRTFVRIGERSRVDLVRAEGGFETVTSFESADAAQLGLDLVHTAEALYSPHRPRPREEVGQRALTIVQWRAGPGAGAGSVELELTVPSGATLWFAMPPSMASNIGRALVAAGVGSSSAGMPEAATELRGHDPRS